MNHKKTAFVFSGGASLGAVEVGMLKAIVEYGIKPDLILGTSVGSINGAFFANNPTMEGVLELEQLWKKIRTKDVFGNISIVPIKKIATFSQHIMDPRNLRTLISEKLTFKKIEDTKIPLYIISTNINTGEEIIFNKGLVAEAIMASAGIPGVFPPQHMGKLTLIDGGIVNNAPISTAKKLGAERIIVFPIGFPYTPNKELKNLTEVIIPTFAYLLNRQLSSDYYIYKDKVDLIIIPAPENIQVGPHDFSKSELLMDQAYKRVKLWLNEDGFEQKKDEFIKACDVHSEKLNFAEAIIPDKGKSAVERIVENSRSLIKEGEEQINELIQEKKDQISEKITYGKDLIKDLIKKRD